MPINEVTVGIGVLALTLVLVFGASWFKKVMAGRPKDKA